MSKKDRRHSGWTYPQPTVKGKKEDIHNAGLDPQPFWDDWIDRRDGLRGYNDHTKKKPLLYWFISCFDARRWNKKIKYMLKRRKRRKRNAKNL